MRRLRPPFAAVAIGNNACNSANQAGIDDEQALSPRRPFRRNFVTLVIASYGIIP